jgi:hypothetical protein
MLLSFRFLLIWRGMIGTGRDRHMAQHTGSDYVGGTTPPYEMLLGRARFSPKPYDRIQIERALASMTASGNFLS